MDSRFLRLIRLLPVLFIATGCAFQNPPYLVGGEWREKHTIPAPAPGPLGVALASLPDVTGDGAREILVGDNYAGPTMPGLPSIGDGPPGTLYVYSGFTTNVFRQHLGVAAFQQFGFSVAALGDVNGDNVPDYACSGPVTPGSTSPQPGRFVIYSGQDGSQIREIASSDPDSTFGRAIANAGDVNNDGIDDLIVGAPFTAIAGDGWAGEVFVYSGSNGSVLWSYQGDGMFTFFGMAVTGMGDLNNDDHDDFAFGAPGASGWPSIPNRVFVHSGIDGSLLWKAEKTNYDGNFGRALAGGGDIDGDNIPDLAIGAPLEDGLTNQDGNVYVYSGASGNLIYERGSLFPSGRWGSSLAMVEEARMPGRYDLVVGAPYADQSSDVNVGAVLVLDGPEGILKGGWFGANANAQLGFAVAAAGDMDGDGLDEIVVSAPGEQIPGIGSAGAVHIYGVDPWMTLSADTISASGSDVVQLLVDFPVSEANKKYSLLVSADLGPTEVDGFWYPLLSPDPFFDEMVMGNTPAGLANVLGNHFGSLDANGDATITMSSHPALNNQVGKTFYLCVASASGTPPQPREVTSARAITVTP